MGYLTISANKELHSASKATFHSQPNAPTQQHESDFYITRQERNQTLSEDSKSLKGYLQDNTNNSNPISKQTNMKSTHWLQMKPADKNSIVRDTMKMCSPKI